MSASEKIRTLWQGSPPDWIEALAQACDQHGQRSTGRRIGYSAAAVNLVLGRRYRGDTSRIEHAVRDKVMGASIPLAPSSPSTCDKIKVLWGGSPPDWIEALARACDQHGQRGIGRRLRYSAATVNLVLNRRYRGDTSRIELSVRGVLMRATVQCPVVGELATDLCQAHQRAAWSANPMRILFYDACRSGCPNSRLKERKHAE